MVSHIIPPWTLITGFELIRKSGQKKGRGKKRNGPLMTPLTAGLANLSRKRFISHQHRQWRRKKSYKQAFWMSFGLFSGIKKIPGKKRIARRGLDLFYYIYIFYFFGVYFVTSLNTHTHRHPHTSTRVWRPLPPPSLCPQSHGGVQLSEVGVGRGRQSGAAVSHGHFHQRLHDVRHPGKRHLRALRAEPHVAVRQHRLRGAQVHRQTHSTVYLQGE